MRTALALLPLALLSTPALADDNDDTVEVSTTTSVDFDTNRAPRGFGLGVVVGDPTGLTFAVRPSERNAVQGHLAWSIIDDRARASLDYIHTVTVIESGDAPNLRFPVYVGLGATAGATGNPPWAEPTPWLGARVPVGITMLPANTPIEVFGEIAPVAYVMPETRPGLEGALGGRFYF